MLELYENIRKFRIEKELSQEELAKRVGYTGKSMVARIEAGQVDLAYSKILAFANALGVKPAVLMGWVKERPTIIDSKTEKLIENYLSLNAEQREKVFSYTEEQTMIQEVKYKKAASYSAKEA